MKRFRLFTCCLAAALIAGFWVAPMTADEGHETPAFVDENGDGLPDNPTAQNMTGAWGPGLHGVFIDEDADGVNDLSQDADSDGIPNGLDSDYLTAKGIVLGRGAMGHSFVDEDGDGVNDLSQDADGDGIPNGIDVDYTLPEGATLQAFGGRGMMGGIRGFIDEDGDGVNDLSQDADGDGIMNGMDPDYTVPDGVQTGRYGHGRGMMGGFGGVGFVDENGDGINDLMLDMDHDGILNGMDADYALPDGVRRGQFGGGYGMGHFNGFVDEDNDGVNDLMQDADADGILNGVDEDYVLPAGVTHQPGGMHGRGGMGGQMLAPGVGGNGVPPADASDMAQRTTDGTVVVPNNTPGTTGMQNQGQMGGRHGGMMGSGEQSRGQVQTEEEKEKGN